MAKKAITTKEDGGLATVSEDMLAAHQEALADLDGDMLALPVLHLYQDVGNESQQYGEHTKGTWVNGLTCEAFTEEPRVMPLHQERLQIAWRDRDEGGGIVAKWKKGEPMPPEARGFEVADHVDLYLYVAGESLPFILRAKSTSLQPVRQLYTIELGRASAKAGPGIYRLGTQKKTNDKGTWYIPRFQPDGAPGEEDAEGWKRARAMLMPALKSGSVQASDEQPGDPVDVVDLDGENTDGIPL